MNIRISLIATMMVACSVISYINAQSVLSEKVDKMVVQLVEQINAYSAVKSVAMGDFTDLNQQIHPLGQRLSQEMLTAMALTRGKNFSVISRSQLHRLMEEVKLDRIGVLSQETIPRLGRLKGIDMIIAATIASSSNVIYLNVIGVELESGDVLAAAKEQVPLTPSLKQWLLSGSEMPDNPTHTAENASNELPATAIEAGGFWVEPRGCTTAGNLLKCEFSVISREGDADLSIYNHRSKISFSQHADAPITPRKMSLGRISGDRRVTTSLRQGEAINLTVFVPVLSNTWSGIAQMELVCYSPPSGTFSMKFSKIPLK